MKKHFLLLISVLIPYFRYPQENKDKTIKITAPLVYTKEEIENFLPLKEKKYKRVNNIRISCDVDYNCGYEITNHKILVHQSFNPKEPPDMNEEEQMNMAEYRKNTIDNFVLHYSPTFKKKMFLDYLYITKTTNYKIIAQSYDKNNDNRGRHRLETYLLEDSIMNLFPKKIRIIDYLKLKGKEDYYFIILAKPNYWNSGEPIYEIYLALVKNKNQNAKLLFLKKENNWVDFSDSSIFGLEEKIIEGNRVVLFHVSTYLISGPIVLHDLHLVWLGKF